MSLIKRADVKNHLSTRTGATTLPARHAADTGPSGNSADSSQDAAAGAGLTSGGVSGTDALVSSAPDAGKQKA